MKRGYALADDKRDEREHVARGRSARPPCGDRRRETQDELQEPSSAIVTRRVEHDQDEDRRGRERDRRPGERWVSS
jgi:hypothetical protein